MGDKSGSSCNTGNHQANNKGISNQNGGRRLGRKERTKRADSTNRSNGGATKPECDLGDHSGIGEDAVGTAHQGANTGPSSNIYFRPKPRAADVVCQVVWSTSATEGAVDQLAIVIPGARRPAVADRLDVAHCFVHG